MKGIIEGLLYVQGDLGLTIEQVSDILEIDTEEAKRLMASAGLEFELSEDLDRAVVGILTYDGKARFNPEEIEATIDHFAKTSLLTIKN